MNKRLVLLAALMVSAIAAGPVQANGSHGERHGRELKAVIGEGEGTVKVTSAAGTVGFLAKFTIKVEEAKPNTTYYVQRAPEVGRPLGDDGICQRAKGIWPWEQPNSAGFPPAPAFVTFPLPLAGDLKTVVTNAKGKGSLQFMFALPAIPDGSRFDVKIRLVDSLSAPTTELRSGCFTVAVL